MALIRLICFFFMLLPFFSSVIPVRMAAMVIIDPCHKYSNDYCGENYEKRVYNPFRLIGKQPERCGSPGFDLHCGNQGTMLIDLPKYTEFGVRGIDYVYETIQIYDPLNCLLNLSGTRFSATHMQNFTLLTCPKDETESLTGSNFTTIPIGCLGNSTFSTLATNVSTDIVRLILTGGNHTSCEISGILQVPTQERRHDHKVFSSPWNPDNDIYLTWSYGGENRWKGSRIMLLITLYCAWLLMDWTQLFVQNVC